MKNIKIKAHARIGVMFYISLFMFTLATHPVAAQSTWSNTDETYPPLASQNWTLTDNWTSGVPSAEQATINLGSALINTSVPDITNFLIGNNADATATRSLLIDDGGSLTATGIFRLFNTAGNHQVTVAAGGSLSVASALGNGTNTLEGGAGSSSIFNSAGTVTLGALGTDKNAITNITGGTTTVSGQTSVGASGVGVLNVSGGAVSTDVLRMHNGTANLSGGSFSASGANALFFYSQTDLATQVLHVDGSGASSISFNGTRYLDGSPSGNGLNPTWKFTLDNGTNHITPVTLTSNGNSGATLRTDATLDVGLNGGILLSGTDTFTLIDRVSTTTYSDTWGTGTGALWTDSSGEDIQVTLAGAANKGSLNAATPGASVTFAAASVGYIDLTGLLGSETSLQLNLLWSGQSTANIADFTTLLADAGLNYWLISANEIGLELDPSVSGSTYFAWDLVGIGSDGMLEGISVIPEPSSFALLGGCLALLVAFRRRR
jgi:hypothetical protein